MREQQMQKTRFVFSTLPSIFQEEASKGVKLYYPFDTHWNQRCHDLTAESIDKYIEQLASYPSSKTAGL